MKRLNGWSLGAAIMLFALASCTNEALLPEAPQVDEPNDPNACQLVGDNFLWEGEETRTSLTIEDNMAKFTWTAGDRVGILPDEGAQVFFTIPEPDEGGEMTNTATFDGGAWALKAESNYAAYYPFVKDFDLDRTEVPVNYKGQKQNGMSTAHLGAYDFQGARPVMTNENGGGVTFDFDHVGALVLLKFTVPYANTALKSVTLSAEDETFVTEGTYDLTSSKDDGFPITATETSKSLTVDVDYTTTTANEEVTVYFMCAPIDLSGKMVNVSIVYGDADEVFNLVAEGKNMVAGNGYVLAPQPVVEPIPYLTFSADAEQTMKVLTWNGYTLDESMQYSVGGGEWRRLSASNAISFGGEGNDLRLRGMSNTGTAETYSKYSTIKFGKTDVQVACTGDIRTLVDYTNYRNAFTADARFCYLFLHCNQLTMAPELPATTLADFCYASMFYGCTSLTDIPELPATTLAQDCYNYMFYGCVGLTEPPALPATTLARDCYCGMFSGCTGLIDTPELPATTLAQYCYYGMFSGCTGLTEAPELPATTLTNACYRDMFSGCTNLTEVPKLSALTLADECYSGMFSGCTNLTTVPVLPVTTLVSCCYSNMFSGCTGLSKAPELPATILAECCYSGMFSGCTGLSEAPELPATTLAYSCYSDMFNGCANLTTASELIATTLAEECYREMFRGCTNLTTAPELPAKTLAAGCYSGMFRSCENLKNVTMLATDISAYYCMDYWLYGVSATGTFTKAAGLKSLPSGDASIPEGWIVQDYTESESITGSAPDSDDSEFGY